MGKLRYLHKSFVARRGFPHRRTNQYDAGMSQHVRAGDYVEVTEYNERGNKYKLVNLTVSESGRCWAWVTAEDIDKMKGLKGGDATRKQVALSK